MEVKLRLIVLLVIAIGIAGTPALAQGTPVDNDGDGYDTTVDCDDNEPSVHPGAVEVCDHRDDNCDGGVDEGFPKAIAAQTLVGTVATTNPDFGVAFGTGVAGIGDVNGDGVPDVAVSATGEPNPNLAEGRIRIFSGRDRSLLCQSGPEVALSEDTWLGWSIAPIADVSGDGVADVLVSASWDGPPSCAQCGAVVILSGADCSVVRRCEDPQAQPSDHVGMYVSQVGDLSGDGVADFVTNNLGGSARGAVILFSGADCNVLRRTQVNTSGPLVGRAVIGAPDLSGDGIPDIVAGGSYSSPSQGQVRIFSGADGSTVRTLRAPDMFSSMDLGVPLAWTPDMTGDGKPDILAGSLYDRGGSVLLFNGATGAFVRKFKDPLIPTNSYALFGASFAVLPDRNGDGKPELVAAVGAVDGGPLVVFNGANGSVLERIYEPRYPGGFVVASCSGIAVPGDLNGDGLVDLAVGLPGWGYQYENGTPQYGTGAVDFVMRESDCDGDGYSGAWGYDCDDTNASVHAGAPEVCNLVDDDCDGAIDDNIVLTCGVGACKRTINGCVDGVPQTCVPGDPTEETCNGIDDDCDGQTDDNLGQTACGIGACQRTVQNCVNGQTQTCVPGAPGVEVCNGIDDDCDGAIDEHPTEETCNGLDDDCDGQIDEGFGQTTCGVGACQRVVDNCSGGQMQTCVPGDPIPETCNGIDDNCNGLIDEDSLGMETDGDGIYNLCDNCPTVYNPDQIDADQDGYGAACDCDDADPNVHPGAVEICNGIDENCSGEIDDRCVYKFQDVTPPCMQSPAYSNGVAWGDYDNDGLVDLYVAHSMGDPSRLFHNDGGGMWTDVTPPVLANTGWGVSVSWADMNNDGYLDLLLTNGGEQPNRVFRNDGGTFSDATNGPLEPFYISLGGAWGDYDNDGNVDIYMSNLSIDNQLVRNTGNGVFVDATSGTLSSIGATADNVTWGDYDNDGDLDLYLTGFDSNRLLRNDGVGNFSDVTTEILAAQGSNTGASWGDYDDDGNLDLFIARYWGNAILLHNDGDGMFTDVTHGDLANVPFSYGVSWGDFDNDGELDLFVASAAGVNRLYHNEGGGVFKDVAPVQPLYSLGNATGSAWADIDNDGDLDLAVATWDGGPDYLFRNALANGNHWIEIDLQGALSNRAAIGARVTVLAGGTQQIREVSGGSGYFSQNALTVHFGLGAVTTIDTLKVRWPSGIVQTLSDVAVDQRIEVVESNTPANNGGPEPVPVTPVDSATGTTPVDVTFETVSSAGITTLTTSSEGPPAPAGFSLGEPPTYYDIETTAQYSEDITVCIRYAGTLYEDENALRLLHGLPGGGWEDITTSLDTVNDLICGVTSSLSPFVVAESSNRPPVAVAGGDQVVEATSPAGASVTIDGSGSHDPDGDGLTYTWSGSFGTRFGAVLTVVLPLGTHMITLTVNDGNGETATDDVTVVVQDTIGPSITIGAPQEGATYLLNQAILAAYSCSDSGSGVAQCSGPVGSGAWFDTTSVGPKSFTVSATDFGGNYSSTTATYRVLYRFTGFFSPVDNPPVLNVVNGGRTIPVKWQVSDAAGVAVSDLASFSSMQSGQVACDASPTDTIPDSATTLSEESLHYDSNAQQFVYNWRTEKSWARTCRQIWLTLLDGTVHIAKFKVK